MWTFTLTSPNSFVKESALFSSCSYSRLLCTDWNRDAAGKLFWEVSPQVKMGTRWSSTCGCAVVEEDLLGWKSPFPNDKFVEGPRHVMAGRLVVARSDQKVRVRVTVALRYVAAGSIAGGEGSIDVDLQTIGFSPCEENMSPIRSWMRRNRLVSQHTTNPSQHITNPITRVLYLHHSHGSCYNHKNKAKIFYFPSLKSVPVLTGKNWVWILFITDFIFWVPHSGFSATSAPDV